MIKVEPEELELQANQLQQALEQYQNQSGQLMNTVLNLKDIWQGKDNEAFTNRLLEYHKDIQQIGLILNDYIQFLKQSTHSYRQVQEDLVSQVQGLKG
ncbi:MULTISPECIES: WXG100 family type VII secretion target [Terrabacteria group]|uniref:WXG100 family type VII secretion target n=1 Tax=Bacillati TaxID=1783272 RepID=UPI001939F7E2|nr:MULTISPECIES: WXG100 family type VII secretion target [Terrabacteria group]MBW9211878.1 WXG100 family type VII secretion target [Trueperella sp. zg.1013]QRG87318.1 WXG100 family type VII secretion target [Bulleidia sp. zg-1006]